MTLIVLAAGLGSRYGGLKQMDPVTPHGEFILDFSVYDAVRAGYEKVIFIIKRENLDAFRETIGQRIEPFIKVEYVFQDMVLPEGIACPPDRVKPFGTAHALLCCRGVLTDDCAVINADDYYGVEPFSLAYDYMKGTNKTDAKEHYCMVGYRMGETLTENGTVSRGVCQVDENQFMTQIVERTKIKPQGEDAVYLDDDGETWVPLSADSISSMNFFSFTPAFLDFLDQAFVDFCKSPTVNLSKDEFYIPGAVTSAVQEGKADLKVLRTTEKWYGVTYREDKQKVVSALHAMVENGRYPDGLWKKK